MKALEIALAGAGIAMIALGGGARRPLLAAWGAVAVGAGYAVLLPSLHGPRGIVTAPLLGGALLVGVEAAFAAAARDESWRSGLPRTATWLLAAGLGAVAVGALVLVATTVHLARSLPLTIAGTLAVVGVLAMMRQRSIR